MIKTHHIQAKKGQISSSVLMMGDPDKAKEIANMYLDNPIQICNIRSIQIWTGEYKNKKITIMGHGMGLSSMGIYAHELFEYFSVEKIIRIGSAAGYHDLEAGDIVIGDNYYTYSLFAEGYQQNKDVAIPDEKFINQIYESSIETGIRALKGGIYSSQWFYAPSFYGEGVKKNSLIEEKINSKAIIAKEMESFALTTIGNHFNKKTATIVTVIENVNNHQPGVKINTTNAAEIALEAIIK